MDCGNKGLEHIHDAVSKGGDLFLGHLDLILKWLTLRMCEREMVPTLVRLLEVLASMLDNLKGRGYQLADFEASIIIPYVCEKSGSAKERIVSSFQAIFLTLSELYPAKKYAPFLVKALKVRSYCQS
jgi:hypothetical protein